MALLCCNQKSKRRVLEIRSKVQQMAQAFARRTKHLKFDVVLFDLSGLPGDWVFVSTMRDIVQTAEGVAQISTCR